MTVRKLALAAFAVCVGTTVYAQTPVQPAQPVQPATERKEAPSVSYRAKQVLGHKVTMTGGAEIGTVDDLVFDDAGNMDYLIINNNGKLITLPWEAAKFNFEQKIATVNLTAEQYKLIPTYTTTTYPSFYTPTYRTEVYKYYGLTPRDLRRLDRPGPRR
jgi:sporulation protein YlmC with PRC-barrel domain